jgi:hypothetical protein
MGYEIKQGIEIDIFSFRDQRILQAMSRKTVGEDFT